ncbi:hypothetical protein OYB56_18375 [Acinetobacter baumannii]|uniref:hypothetical protein n=1 Tax=Acinetobacter baumannii TaxID=470 RepID=UPI0022786E39|nr:hypothetical protein [Acinetobacter baumannii]MCY6989944.1 hypothetical protein [Acinetobacter baumannii]
MDNYKIKVKDEAESKEAQELFFELGYSWLCCGKYYNRIGNYTFITAYPDEMLLRMGWGGDTDKELTLPQLQDLVVLKRNDVKDATHRDKQQNSIYLTSDMVIYYWQGEWCKSAINKSNDYENYIANSLTPITQPQDPALISGDVALANVHKCIVQYLHDDEPYGRWTTITDHFWSQYHLGMFLDPDTKFKFRFKPQTIKIELEIPAPFQPKEGEQCCYISDESIDGYHTVSYNSEKYSGMHFGLYRPSDIEKVVALFRSAFGGAS